MAKALSGKQRAALRKAQLASARKRRGKKLRRRIAYGATALAVTGAIAGGAYAGRSYIHKVAKSGPRRPVAKPMLALPPGRTITRGNRGRKNYTGRGHGGAFKVSSNGTTTYIKRISGRGRYDKARRDAYKLGKLKARR